MIQIVSRMFGDEILEASVGNDQTQYPGWIAENHFASVVFQFTGDG